MKIWPTAASFAIGTKGSDVAAIDDQTAEAVTLFNPRLHQWPDHFSLSGAIINPMTPEGRVTARVLRFNQAERITERTILQGAGQYPRGIR